MRANMSKRKTIVEVVKNGLCTGCGTCAGICPGNAVEMVIDRKKGLYVPCLDKERCTECGLCFEVCPGHAVDFKQLNLEIFGKGPDDLWIGNYLSCYTGYSTDYSIRYNSASGGLVTTLLIYALEEGIIDGALVTRMKRDKPLEPEPFIARTREELISAANSKYCPVPANVALEEILDKPERYAVVGLPCHLHGVRKAERVSDKLKDRVVLRIGVFCSGAHSFRATEYLLRQLKVPVESIRELSYRGSGWPGNMSLRLKDDNVKVTPYPDYWDGFGAFFLSTRCKFCLDWYSSLSDVSLGDAWLPEVRRIDKAGTSTIISRTMQAESVLRQMVAKRTIDLHPISACTVLKSQKGFARKKERLKVRLTLAWVFRKQVTSGDYQHLEQPTVSDYLVSVLLYLGTILASKRRLWWSLDAYCWLLRSGSRVKAGLRL